MGIFDKIKDAIWGNDIVATPTRSDDPIRDSYLGTQQATTGVVPHVATPANDPVLRDVAASGVQPMAKPADIEQAQEPTARMTEVDVTAQLDRAVAAEGQDLNWRSSVVDLMKAVGMDASLDERRDLAREPNYTGDTNDTASMNIFLHRAIMRRLAENGGRVPAELLD
jgi:hypothetical protein